MREKVRFSHWGLFYGVTACGARENIERITFALDVNIVCVACKRSELYKQCLIDFELNYERSPDRWRNDWHHGLLADKFLEFKKEL